MKNTFYSDFIRTMATLPQDKSGAVWNTRYVESILNVNAKFDLTVSELEFILRALDVKGKNPLDHSKDFLRIMIKNYSITVVTLSEIILDYINCVYSIGLKTRHCNYDTVIKNYNIETTELPDIFKRYHKELSFDRVNNERNFIVHENIINSIYINIFEREYEEAINLYVENMTDNRKEEYMTELKITLTEIAINYYSKVYYDLKNNFENILKFTDEVLVSLSNKFKKRVYEMIQQ